MHPLPSRISYPINGYLDANSERRRSRRPVWALRQAWLGTIFGTVCTLSFAAQAPSVPTATPPAEIQSPVLDERVDSSNSKQKKGNGSEAPGSGSDLDQAISSGDLGAAITKADNAKKNNQPVTSLSNAAAVVTIIDSGVTSGVPDAFRAKGVVEIERGNTSSAVTNLLEASARGSAEADYELAALKARQPSLTSITDSPIALLNRAATRGDARAAMELGLALDRGAWLPDKRTMVKVEQSAAKAVAWMERAVLLGSPEAAFWLGLYNMRQTKSLVDVSRGKAIQLLLLVRRESPTLREPETGLTFAELEARGMIEEGLLGELKRREAKEQAVKANPTKRGPKGPEIKASRVTRIDNESLAIAGDAQRPVYHLIGFSPYRDLLAEGNVTGVTKSGVQVDQLSAISDIANLRLEISTDGKKTQAFAVEAIDIPGKSVRTGSTGTLVLAKNMRWRLVRYHTFFSVFGTDNRIGLRPGVSAATADEVILLDPVTNRLQRYFFHRDTLTWTDRSGTRLTADFEIPSGTGLAIKRSEPGPLALTVRGTLPPTTFLYEPDAAVSLVSLRQNELKTASVEIKGPADAPYVPASDLPVLTAKGKNGKWTVAKGKQATAWWTTFGLNASDLVSLTGVSAVICIQE